MLLKIVAQQEIIENKLVCQLIGTFTFTILTTLGAYIYIPLPFTPVPITLQTLFVLLSGAVLSNKYGSLSQLLYVGLGALGLPLFYGAKGGISHLLGPTGGYLIGFVIASYIIGSIIRKNNNFYFILLSMIIGSIIIYILGGLQLALFLHIGIKKTILLGIIPFLPGDILKILVAASIFYKFKNKLTKIFQ